VNRTQILAAIALVLSVAGGVLLALREPPLVVRAYGHATHDLRGYQ